MTDTVAHPRALPLALTRVDAWASAWRRSGRLVLLLDFDGTLAPIVDRPGDAAMPPATREALTRVMRLPGAAVAVVSGRALADVRARANIDGITYAGNHGMEISGPGVHRVHPGAVAARRDLQRAHAALTDAVADVSGAWVEDKGLTLSVHVRMAQRDRVPALRCRVRDVVEPLAALQLAEGKEVLEVRPRDGWNKGDAVLWLLVTMDVPPGAPVLYLGDDRTDEDAFTALRDSGRGDGVVIGEHAVDTAATSQLRDPAEVGRMLEALADARARRAGSE